jgi:hypothetical protein
VGSSVGHQSISHSLNLAKLLKTLTIYRKKIMLYTIAVVLIILWLLGMVSAYTIGGFIHVLLVIAIVMILLRLISGRGV